MSIKDYELNTIAAIVNHLNVDFVLISQEATHYKQGMYHGVTEKFICPLNK